MILLPLMFNLIYEPSTIFFNKIFWHLVNFKLKYLGSQWSVRIGKVCSSSFQGSPFVNFKGSFGRLKISSPFFLDTLYKL